VRENPPHQLLSAVMEHVMELRTAQPVNLTVENVLLNNSPCLFVVMAVVMV
jgi:hypothetical protein